MLRFFRYMVFPVVFMAILSSIPVHAQGNILRVAFNELPPWKVLDDYGAPDGIDVRLLELVAERMGLEIQYAQYPFKRGLHLLEVGEIDMMTGVLRRPEREEYLHFVEPPYKAFSNKAFYVRRGEEGRITRHEDLHSLRVGTRFGANYYPRFDNDPDIEKENVGTLALSVKMLLAGRIDAFVLTESSGDYEIRRGTMPEVVSKAEFVYSKKQEVYMVVSKASPFAGMIEDFNEVLAELVKEGAPERLKEEFFESMQ